MLEKDRQKRDRRRDERQKARREDAGMRKKSGSNSERERKKYGGPEGEGKRETQSVS